MKQKRIIIISVIFLLVVVVLGLAFQMQIRGYVKLGKVDDVVIYHKKEQSCATLMEEIYDDGMTQYYLPCLSSQFYIIKDGNEEYNIKDALANGIITIDEARKYIAIFPFEANQ